MCLLLHVRSVQRCLQLLQCLQGVHWVNMCPPNAKICLAKLSRNPQGDDFQMPSLQPNMICLKGAPGEVFPNKGNHSKGLAANRNGIHMRQALCALFYKHKRDQLTKVPVLLHGPQPPRIFKTVDRGRTMMPPKTQS